MMETILAAMGNQRTKPPWFCAAAKSLDAHRLRRFPSHPTKEFSVPGRYLGVEAHGLTHKQPVAHVISEPRLLTALRRAFDLVFAGTMILLLSPLLIGVVIAIRLDSRGSALFRQRRVGLGEREFTLFKFRSMRLDADPRGHQAYVTALIKGGDGEGMPDGGRKDLYKLAVDDRITPVGRWIRKWSVDELPQLFNVVLGDMTLVGPRPAIPYEVSEYPTWYLERFSVKPGLTGYWQVSGRSERTYEEMVRLDIEYAERRSLTLDLSILVKTPWIVLSRKGAE
jgi:lipopolysaccharide/colanic/teichoic acid biosynthesis glycosyltransferase